MSAPARPRPAFLPETVRAYAALIAGMCCVSSSGIFVRLAGVPGPVAGLYRMVIAVLTIAIPLWRSGPFGSWTRRSVLVALLAGMVFAGDVATWNTSVFYTSIANASLLANTAPIWVGLGAMILLRERLGFKFWAGLVVALIGAVIILGVRTLTAWQMGRGDLLALIASFFFGGYILIGQRGRARLDALSFFWLAAIGSCLTLLAICLALRLPLAIGPRNLLPLLGLGLVTQIGGWLTINHAQGHLRAAIVSPTLLGMPAVATLFAWLAFREAVSWQQLIGGLVVVGGIYLVHKNAG